MLRRFIAMKTKIMKSKILKPLETLASALLLTLLVAFGPAKPTTVEAQDAAAKPAAAPATPAGAIHYDAQPTGSKMKIEGTSNVHDWRADSPLILGYLEVGPGFPLEAGQSVTPGKVEAKGQAIVITRTLTSKKENGDHYDNKMDENIYKGLKANEVAGSNIVFYLKELVLKEAPKSKDAPYVFDSKGDLEIAGVTNSVSIPINVLLVTDEKTKVTKVKISGTTSVKMSEYKVTPATFLLGAFTVGDPVSVKFDWMLGPQPKAPPAAASK